MILIGALILSSIALSKARLGFSALQDNDEVHCGMRLYIDVIDGDDPERKIRDDLKFPLRVQVYDNSKKSQVYREGGYLDDGLSIVGDSPNVKTIDVLDLLTNELIETY